MQARTCKWLLRMHDLAGPELLLPREFLAQMMGVRRTSVTGAASELQEAGLITYARGPIRINDIGRARVRSRIPTKTGPHHRRGLDMFTGSPRVRSPRLDQRCSLSEATKTALLLIGLIFEAAHAFREAPALQGKGHTFESFRARQYYKGPFRTHGLRFIPET